MSRIERAWVRGAGPLAVLTLLDQREMYGYELAQALDSRSNGVLALGHSTLYSLLYNLESKGYVEPVERASEEGRTRKYYVITDRGRKWLRSRASQWDELVDAMSQLGLGA